MQFFAARQSASEALMKDAKKRVNAIKRLSDLLVERQTDILFANDEDLKAASYTGKFVFAFSRKVHDSDDRNLTVLLQKSHLRNLVFLFTTFW